MFKKLFVIPALILAAVLCFGFAQGAMAAPEIGQPAPDFEGVNVLTGETVKLSDLKGKTVVLEWTNAECPYVVKHYSSGNMQKTQETAKADFGATWITVLSSAPGKQGHLTAEDAKKGVEESKAVPDAKILDETGAIGKLYDAQTTPHMFIVNAEGNLVYKGAIDSDSSTRPEAIEGSTNYVLAALTSLKDGKAIEHASTQPYDCAVKY